MYHFLFIFLISSLPHLPSFPSFFLSAPVSPVCNTAVYSLIVEQLFPSATYCHLIYGPLLSAAFIFHPPDFRRLRCIIVLSSLRRPDRRHPSGEGAGRRQRGEEDGMMEEHSEEKHGGSVMDENTRRHSNDSALFLNWHNKHWLCTEAVEERSHWQIQFKENAFLTNTAIRSNSCGNILSHWPHHSSSYCMFHSILLPTSRHPMSGNLHWYMYLSFILLFETKQKKNVQIVLNKALLKDFF